MSKVSILLTDGMQNQRVRVLHSKQFPRNPVTENVSIFSMLRKSSMILLEKIHTSEGFSIFDLYKLKEGSAHWVRVIIDKILYFLITLPNDVAAKAI